MVAALVVAWAKLVGAFVVGALVVGAVDTFTQAHLSVGSGSPNSYQCKYPGLQVQQLRTGAAVLVAAFVAARVVGALVVGALVVGALVTGAFVVGA